jgi:hypothetical protein
VNQVQLTPDDLGAQFGFTPEELALNRAGEFSARQRQTLFFLSVGYLVRGLALIVLIIVLVAAVADHHTIGGMLLGLLFAGIVLLYLRAAYQVMFPRITVITGSLRRGSDARHPTIFAADTALRISFRRWKRLKASYPGTYRFYVAPDLILLSLEPWNEDESP